MAEKQLLGNTLRGQHSPASAYLLSILEKKTREETYQTGVSNVERVTSAFACLSEVLPYCGVYAPVLKLVREELLNAVYSDTFTAAQADETPKSNDGSKVPKLERVPYFVLMQRLQEQRNEDAEALQKKLESLQKKLIAVESVINDRDMEIKALQEKLGKVEFNFMLSQNQVRSKCKEIEGLNGKIDDIEKEASARQMELVEEIDHLLIKKRELMDENADLRPYKMNYETLKDTFDLPPEKRPKRGFRRPILATKKTQLLSSIEAASKLEQQILEIQNKTLEEQDQYLEEVKEKLSEKKYAENTSDPNFYNEELILESMGDEMAIKQQNFQRVISGMVVELELIRTHREALQNELNQLEQVELGARAVPDGDGSIGGGTMVPSSMAGGRPGSSRMLLFDEGKKTGRDSLSLVDSGLEEDNSKLTDPTSDPFNPHERVLSKYSAMIYTSVNGGKSFDEINCAKFCKSCGEKTAICPHKVTKEDMIVRLPKRCTHVKLSRPQVRTAISISQQGLPQTASTLYPGRRGADTWLSSRQEPHGWDGSGEWAAEEEMRRQLLPLWDDFKSRTGTEKHSLLPVSRELSHSRVISLIEQLYASIIWQDDHTMGDDDDDSIGTVKDYLYNFISERYQEDEISPMATFDFLAGVTKYAAHDKVIYLFGLVTSGIVDASIPRYIHLVADLIDMVEWTEVKDFVGFAEALYPFMADDDIDQLVVEYTAFSENKISKYLIMDYIIHITLKNKEPRLQDSESKLLGMQVATAGQMTFAEFSSAMESAAPLTNEKLWRRLAKETYRLDKPDVAPISNLAGIMAYASLVQVIQLLKSQIVGKVEKAREDRRLEGAGSKLSFGKQLVSEAGRLLTLKNMKQLGFNVSRQRQAGTRQMDNEFDDFYWQSRPNTQDRESLS